jgi:hypothetical protein
MNLKTKTFEDSMGQRKKLHKAFNNLRTGYNFIPNLLQYANRSTVVSISRNRVAK